MRKYFMIGAVITAMVLTVGCGNSKKEEATTATATTVAETTAQETTVEETTTVAETTVAEEITTKAKKKAKNKADKDETAMISNDDETTEKVTEKATEKVTKKVETTTKKAKKVVKKSSEKATKAKLNSNGKSTAKKYIGKNMDELVAAIGKYKSMDKDKSCLEEGEYDGFFYYDGFTVSATTKNGQWIINSVD